MSILLHPSYLPNIANYVAMVHASDVIFEVHDTYQKQTFRNRSHIYGANGIIALNVPVVFTQMNRQMYKDVKISNDEKWQSHHWKSLQSAYKTSPYFEYYEDDLASLYHEPQVFIMEFNLKCLKVIAECLQWDFQYTTSNSFEKSPNSDDYRFLINARKKIEFQFNRYTQVFSIKHGFLSNLSILDLLFNEGPNAINYLQSQNITTF